MVIPACIRNERIFEHEGYVKIRQSLLSRRQIWYMRLQGSVLSLHTSEDENARMEKSVFGCKVACTLLPRGFVIKLKNGQKLRVSCFSKGEASKWKQALALASTKSFENKYKGGGEVELSGRWAVFKAESTADKTEVSVQRFRRHPHGQNKLCHQLAMGRQMYALQNLHHPSILTAIDNFVEKKYAFIICKPFSGKKLRDVVAESGGVLSERTTKCIVRQVVSAIDHLHRSGYIHRNVSLDSILCDFANPTDPKALLSTFNHVDFVDDEKNQAMRSAVGRKQYRAPEMIDGRKYNASIDMYALGVCIFRMLCGSFPFRANTRALDMIHERKGPLHFDRSAWNVVSAKGKDFVRSLLDPTWQKRPTARLALESNWLSTDSSLYAVSENESVSSKTSSQLLAELLDRTADVRMANDSEPPNTEGFDALLESYRPQLSPFMQRFLQPLPNEASAESPVDAYKSIFESYGRGIDNDLQTPNRDTSLHISECDETDEGRLFL